MFSLRDPNAYLRRNRRATCFNTVFLIRRFFIPLPISLRAVGLFSILKAMVFLFIILPPLIVISAMKLLEARAEAFYLEALAGLVLLPSDLPAPLR